MLHQTKIEPEANEMSFDLEEFINQYTTSSETWNNENFDWMGQPQESDMSLWGDLSLTAAQQDLIHTTPSGFSEIYVPFEDFEQFFYSSPEPQIHPSPGYSSSDSLFLDGLSPSTSETISDQPSSQSQSPQPPTPPSDSGSVYKCRFCAETRDKRHLLNRHEKQHIKPVRCPVPGCNHGTAKRRDMQRHIIVHHRDSDPSVVVPQFMCPVAGCKHAVAGFKRKDHLVRHMERKHPGMSP